MSYVALAIVAMILFIGCAGFLFHLYREHKSHSALAGVFFFAFLALLMFWSAMGLSLTEYREAECENLKVYEETQFIYGDNYSGYHWEYESPEPTCNAANQIDCVKIFETQTNYTYVNSCSEDTVNGVMEFFFVLLTWLVYIAFVAGFFVPIVLFIRWVGGLL